MKPLKSQIPTKIKAMIDRLTDEEIKKLQNLKKEAVNKLNSKVSTKEVLKK